MITLKLHSSWVRIPKHQQQTPCLLEARTHLVWVERREWPGTSTTCTVQTSFSLSVMDINKPQKNQKKVGLG
jgi:hypothetical protein